MEFIETSVFSKSAHGLLEEDDLTDLQSVLMLRPEAGTIIPGPAGCRKLRWALPGRGKSGGARVIYYWLRSDHQIYLLLAYAKNRQENLTPEQARLLRHIVEDL